MIIKSKGGVGKTFQMNITALPQNLMKKFLVFVVVTKCLLLGELLDLQLCIINNLIVNCRVSSWAPTFKKKKKNQSIQKGNVFALSSSSLKGKIMKTNRIMSIK